MTVRVNWDDWSSVPFRCSIAAMAQVHLSDVYGRLLPTGTMSLCDGLMRLEDSADQKCQDPVLYQHVDSALLRS